MAKGRIGRKAGDSVAVQLRALEEMEYAALRAEWSRHFRTEPPRRVTRKLLMLGIAWKIQERAYGGLSLFAKRQLGQSASARRARSVRLRPGAKLIREWHGETHTVTVLEKGYEWRGTRWRSLSAIAREISGGHWSGPRFFGLAEKPRSDAADDGPDSGSAHG